VTAPLESRDLPFNARHYEDRLRGLPEPAGRRKGYEKGQVERLVRDLIGHVVKAMAREERALTQRDAARDAHRLHADAEASTRQPYERSGPPTLAIDAVVQGQLQAERTDRAANLEAAHQLDNARRVQRDAEALHREAESLLERARENAATERPTLTLPDAPAVEIDSLAGQAAIIEYLQAARDAVAAHRVELAEWETQRQEALAREERALDEQQRDLDEQEQALAAQRGEVVANLDRIAEEAPRLRERVEAIDLTGPGEPTQAMEVA
jgi:hypothetical protein